MKTKNNIIIKQSLFVMNVLLDISGRVNEDRDKYNLNNDVEIKY